MYPSTRQREKIMNLITAAAFEESTSNQATNNTSLIEGYSEALRKKFSMLLTKNYFKSHEKEIGVNIAKKVALAQDSLDILCRQWKNGGGWKDVTVNEVKSEGKMFYRFTFYR